MFKWLKKKPKIKVISPKEFDKIPIGEPIPSILPKEGYGNHSCRNCLYSIKCPVHLAMRTNKPDEWWGWDTPNRCSFYWPPNSPLRKPDKWYYDELDKIANEIAGN